MHTAHVAHLDLKPSNILVEKNSLAKTCYTAVLADFGISKCFDSSVVRGWKSSSLEGFSLAYADRMA